MDRKYLELYEDKLIMLELIKKKKQEIKKLKKSIREINGFYRVIRYWFGIKPEIVKDK